MDKVNFGKHRKTVIGFLIKTFIIVETVRIDCCNDKIGQETRYKCDVMEDQAVRKQKANHNHKEDKRKSAKMAIKGKYSDTYKCIKSANKRASGSQLISLGMLFQIGMIETPFLCPAKYISHFRFQYR